MCERVCATFVVVVAATRPKFNAFICGACLWLFIAAPRLVSSARLGWPRQQAGRQGVTPCPLSLLLPPPSRRVISADRARKRERGRESGRVGVGVSAAASIEVRISHRIREKNFENLLRSKTFSPCRLLLMTRNLIKRIKHIKYKFFFFR